MSSRQRCATSEAPVNARRLVTTRMKRVPLVSFHATKWTRASGSLDRTTVNPCRRRSSRASCSAVLARPRSSRWSLVSASFTIILVRLLVLGIRLAVGVRAWLAGREGADHRGPLPVSPCREIRALLLFRHHWPSQVPRFWFKTSRCTKKMKIRARISFHPITVDVTFLVPGGKDKLSSLVMS